MKILVLDFGEFSRAARRDCIPPHGAHEAHNSNNLCAVGSIRLLTVSGSGYRLRATGYFRCGHGGLRSGRLARSPRSPCP